MIISGWCLVAIVALIVGGICSIILKDRECFIDSTFLVLMIGIGYFILNGY